MTKMLIAYLISFLPWLAQYQAERRSGHKGRLCLVVMTLLTLALLLAWLGNRGLIR